jgi:cytochrome c
MKRIVLPVMALIGTLVGCGLLVGAGLAVDYKADFSKELDKGWSFVREDKADWRLRDGKLQLLAQPSNIWGKKNNKTENFLLRALPGPKAVVEVTVDFNPRKEYEQAGLMLYLDDDNYIKFDRELYGGQSCTLVLESKAKPKVVKKIPFREGPLRLRLEISDGKVKAMVKAPGGKDWTAHGETTLPGSSEKVKVGVFALLGDAKNPRWATFSDFVLGGGD